MVPEWMRNLFSPPEVQEEEGGEVSRPPTTVAMLSRPHGRNGVIVCEARLPVDSEVLIARQGRLIWAPRLLLRLV